MTAKTIATAAPMVTISITAAAFAEAERDRIREWVGQVKADQNARSRYLGGKAPFGSRPPRVPTLFVLLPRAAEQHERRLLMQPRAKRHKPYPFMSIAGKLRQP